MRTTLRFPELLRSKRLARDERGATAVEYALIIVFIAAVIVLAVTAVGQDAVRNFDTVEKAFP